MNEQILALDGLGGSLEGQFSFSERVSYLKQYGEHTQAFSTLQPGMSYFDIPGIGYVSFMRRWGMTFVLADPVAAPEHFEFILTRFHRQHPNACYIQVSQPVVEILNRRFGLYGTQFGSESRIMLRHWSLRGKKKQVIRTALNQARRDGIMVRERFGDGQTREISDAWIQTRKVKSTEIRFLIRPMEMPYRENERQFYAYRDGKAVGFIYFDPVYKDGNIISYVPNISRASMAFRQGIFYTIMAHAMETFRDEGVPAIDLGLIPLSLDPSLEPHESRLLKRGLHWLYLKGNGLYNFKGIEFTKSRFRGERTRTYCCHRRILPVPEFLAMLRLTRVF